MTLRRLGTLVPLAVLVAILVHLALFGTEHAPGEHQAGRLYSGLGASLALAALASVLYAALRAGRPARRERRAANLHRGLCVLQLAAGGTLAFGLIELAEGHMPLAGGAWQFATTAIVAYAVAMLAHQAARLLTLSGRALAALANTVMRSPAYSVFTRALRSFLAQGALRPNANRGRAPPIFR